MVHRQTRDHVVRHDDAGMSLVEVLMAVVVLGILSTAVFGVILRTQAANVDTRSRTAAASLAQREIEYVREEFLRSPTSPIALANAGVVTNPHPLAGGTAGSPLVLDGMAYTVTRSASWNVTGPGASACEGGSLVQHPTLGVTVTVTWPNMSTTRPVVSHIQLAPPKGTNVSDTQAFVAVKVVNSAGQPNSGRTVHVSSPTGGSGSALSDSAGCAVVAVTPPAAGATYTAKMLDSGHVDVSGTANPTKTTGALRPGQLNASLSFAYDRAAMLRLRVVDGSGAPYTDTAAAGAPLTVAATQASGASATTNHTATGTVTGVPNLWPARYGAYFGSTPPPGGYTSVELGPGAVVDLDVVLQMAEVTLTNLPPGTDRVVAVPGTGACTAPEARDVDPADVNLVPGPWSFYASGPAFDCAAGPSSAVLVDGENGSLAFTPSGLQVTGVPAGGVLWAVSTTRVAGATTCPGPAGAPFAQNVDAARGGPLEMPAGDWFVFRTDGAPDGRCVSLPNGAYPQRVSYGVVTTLAWVDRPAPVTLTVTSVPTGQNRVVAFRTAPSANCTTTLPTGAVVLGQNATTVTGALEQGTWYVYRVRTDGSNTGRCTALGGTAAKATLNLTGGPTTWTADFVTGAVTGS